MPAEAAAQEPHAIIRPVSVMSSSCCDTAMVNEAISAHWAALSQQTSLHTGPDMQAGHSRSLAGGQREAAWHGSTHSPLPHSQYMVRLQLWPRSQHTVSHEHSLTPREAATPSCCCALPYLVLPHKGSPDLWWPGRPGRCSAAASQRWHMAGRHVQRRAPLCGQVRGGSPACA